MSFHVSFQSSLLYKLFSALLTGEFLFVCVNQCMSFETVGMSKGLGALLTDVWSQCGLLVIMNVPI